MLSPPAVDAASVAAEVSPAAVVAGVSVFPPEQAVRLTASNAARMIEACFFIKSSFFV